MRKALMSLVLAATVLTPIAVQAQDNRAEQRQRLEQRGAQRAERQTQRAERREASQAAPEEAQTQPEARAERRARREARQQAQPAPEQQVVRRQRFESRSGDGQRPERRSTEFQRVERTSDGQASQAWQGDPNDPRREHYERLGRRNQWRYGTPEQREVIRQERRSERGDRDGRDWRGGDRDGRDWRRGDRDGRRDWNRDWRRDRRYDWSSWRGRNRSIFRLSRYYSPYRNWGYNRFSIGFFLPSLFYSQRYWVGDPWQYRLPHAPPGTQWVRYYNDVLLVDTWTGEVVDVIYDFFW
jgi:Ni/Co efflux regulator RcnB